MSLPEGNYNGQNLNNNGVKIKEKYNFFILGKTSSKCILFPWVQYQELLSAMMTQGKNLQTGSYKRFVLKTNKVSVIDRKS